MAWGPGDTVTRASKTLPKIPTALGAIHFTVGAGALVAGQPTTQLRLVEGSTPTLNVTFDEYQELLFHISRAEVQSNVAVTNF